MTPYIADPDFQLYVGDALEVLRQLPDESVDCAATSPPFYALRDYGVEGQIGLEATPEEWCARLVEVFRELRRVLVKAGTLWIECGDSYAGSWGAQGRSGQMADRSIVSARSIKGHPKNQSHTGSIPPGTDLKPKDLIGAPFLLAFALRADGWWWRSTNIWHKPNCLPESAEDRTTVAHSYVFEFAANGCKPLYWTHPFDGRLVSEQPAPDYWWFPPTGESGQPSHVEIPGWTRKNVWEGHAYFHNAEAVREPAEWARWGDQTIVKEQPGKAGWIQPKSKTELRQKATTEVFESGSWKGHGSQHHPDGRAVGGPQEGAQRNLRSVWTIPTQGFPDAHFATWPEALIERIIKMACPEQVCRMCGKPREPITETSYDAQGRTTNGPRSLEQRHETAGFAQRLVKSTATLGLSDCGHNDYRVGIILDPFLGSGTTALVARRLGRACVGIELSEEYAKMAAERTRQLSLLAS